MAADLHPGHRAVAGPGPVHHPAEDGAAGLRRSTPAGRSSEVAADFRVAWWTVQATINAAAVLLPKIDGLHQSRLGIDEHRYRRVRWFRGMSGGWRRVEPLMSRLSTQPRCVPTSPRKCRGSAHIDPVVNLLRFVDDSMTR